MRLVLSVVLLGLLAGPPTLDEAVAALSVPSHLAPRCDDAEFLRRTYFDLLGYPPNAAQTEAFLSDPAPGKRERTIDELLGTPRFSDYWARRFAEVFFGNYHEPTFDVPPGLTIETRRRLLTNFIAWFREQIRDDRPWADVMTDVITARGSTESSPQVAYKLSLYTPSERQEYNFASQVTRHFLAIDLHCARCHDHPYENWGLGNFLEFAAFNVRQRTERRVVKGVEQLTVTYAEEGELDREEGKPMPEVYIGFPRLFSPGYFGAPARDDDRAAALARFMRNDPKHPVAKALANRVWFWLMGRGVYEPVDSLNRKNKPASEDLLNALISLAEDGQVSVKSLVRVICRTEAYQRSSQAANRCDKRHFCRAEILPLTGEQLINAVQVALRGAPGLNLDEAQELTAALSMRPRVGCEVVPLPCGTLHALMFRNSERLWSWIHDSPVLTEIRKGAPTDDAVVERLFLAVVSRPPSPSERSRFAGFIHDRGTAGIWDACWTLLNTAEFLTRH
jgi:hypothetical protein